MVLTGTYAGYMGFESSWCVFVDKGDNMSGFYSLVPFEGKIYLIKAIESKPLEGAELEVVNELLSQGKAVADIQEELSNVWQS